MKKMQVSGFRFQVPGIGILCAFAFNASAADWAQWRGPERTGISSETGWTAQWPAGGPKELWKKNVGIGCSSVAIANKRLFTMGNHNNTDTVWCHDAETGALIWKYSYACPLDPNLFEGGPAATPTVDGDRVFTISRSGHVFCFTADKGEIIWKKHLKDDLGGRVPKWGYSASALIIDGKLIVDVGAPDAATVAFDKTTGAIVWKSGSQIASYGTIMPFTHAGKTCLASFDGVGLTIREMKTGKELASFPWKTSYDINAATPIIDSDKIFISSGYNHGCALLQFTGAELKLLWEHKKMRNHFNSSVLWKGSLYGFDESTLTCLDFASGEVKWKQDGLGKGSLMLADGKLIIQGEQGDLAIADASPGGYKEFARAKVLSKRCWVVPVLANGRIYNKNNAGDLVCLDVSGK